ncbi:MAG TPA: SDR family oxidoreductase [Candidatus Angelobacter sp.]|nr:SDR family oxidoreductase [Candidatus Angelobacter sp.]
MPPPQKIALITGANRGIGLEIARQLGGLGMIVVVGSRNAERGKVAGDLLRSQDIDAQVVELDVTRQDTIDAAVQEIERKFGRLDVLVNNAGVLLDRVSPAQIELAVLRSTYETNVFGAFAVTKAMLPLLKKSDAPRVVNISSGAGSLAKVPNLKFRMLAYNSSKAALNSITALLAQEFKDTKIKINAADPGSVATDINNYRGTKTVEQGAKPAVHLATLPDDGPTGGFFDETGTVPW